MITCARCKTVNPPEQRYCQKCHRDLLPGENILTRLGILLAAGLVTAFGVWVLMRMVQGEQLPDLGCAFTSPVYWAILVVVTPIAALKMALTRTPAHQKYLNRARRHLSLDSAQALADLNQALALAPEKERPVILKERARLHESLGQKLQATRDKIAHIESEGAYQAAEGIAALTGMDRDVFANGIKDSDIQALVKAHEAIPLGYCPKCKDVVELSEKMKCQSHPRARIASVRLAVPEDASKIKAAILEAQTKLNRLNRRRAILQVVAFLALIILLPYGLKLGPFAPKSDAGPFDAEIEPTAEVALPAVASQQGKQPEPEQMPSQYFDEHEFYFEIPGDWLWITEADHSELFTGSLRGINRNAVDYLGGAYTGGLDACSGCAQVVIVVVEEPTMTGQFSEGQFLEIKQNQQANMGERLLSYDYVFVSGFPAAESHHIGRSGETRLWEYIVVPPEPGLVYLISMSSLREEYADFEPVFARVTATLRIGPEPEPTATPVPTRTPGATTSAIVLNGTINVRAGPGKEHAILGSAEKDTQLEVRGVNPSKDWYLIYTPELGEGWVSASLVSLQGPLEELPVVSVP